MKDTTAWVLGLGIMFLPGIIALIMMLSGSGSDTGSGSDDQWICDPMYQSTC